MRIRIVFTFFLLTCSLHTFGQLVQDAQLWKGLILEKKFLDERIKLSFNEEVRLVQNFSAVGNAYTDVIGEYNFTKRLSLGAGYRYAVRPEVNIHRVYSDFTWQPKIKGRIGINLRTRFQYDWSPVSERTMIRPKIQLSYNIEGTKLEPYLGVEPFFRIRRDVELSGYRLMGGVRYPLRKKVELRAGYIWDMETDEINLPLAHVFLVRVVVDLDKGSDKDESEK